MGGGGGHCEGRRFYGVGRVSAATMAATANLGIGGYYDDDCYVVRRRVLTPYGWRIQRSVVCG
jgi:hypothetical protein